MKECVRECVKESDNIPFLLVHDWRALVLANLLVGVNTNDEIVAHRLCLAKSVGVAKVHHVKASHHQRKKKERRVQGSNLDG